MTVLAMPLSLGDSFPGRILDTEALVRKVVDDRLRQWGAKLKTLDHEELVSYLISVAWELSCRYDPAKDKNPNFAAYAAKILQLRVADWFRQRFGDTRHGEKPVVLSLDAPIVLSSVEGEGGAYEGSDRLVDTLVASTGDPAVDRSPDLVGLLERRSGSGLGSHNALGESSPRGASSRDRSAAKGLKVAQGERTRSPRVPGTSRGPARPPICRPCFKTFNRAFSKVNGKLAAERQETDEQITLRAAKRAQAVRFGTEWACPRCTKLTTGPTKDGYPAQELMLQSAYPNRTARRGAAAGVKANGRDRQKPAGANKGRGAAKRSAAATQKSTTRARKAA